MGLGHDDEERVMARIKATDVSRAQLLGGAFAVTFLVAALADAWGMGTLRHHGFMMGQFLSSLAVAVIVRWTPFGRRRAAWIFAAGMTTSSALGAAHLSQFGGLDGPWFYGSYTAAPVMIPMLFSLRARLLWTAATVLAFAVVYRLGRPDVFEHPMAHVPMVYLLTISGISIALGHHVSRLEIGSFVDVTRLETAAAILEAQLREDDAHPARLREEIARQLHDDVAQLITGARLQLDGWSQRRAKDDAARRLAELLDELARRSRRMLDELRTPPVRGSLQNELERLRSEYRALGLALDVVLQPEDPAPSSIDGEQTEVIVSSVREALTNAVRHGGATEATVSLRLTDAAVVITILDNGAGRVVDIREGYGLKGIRERVEQLGGQLGLSDYEEGLRLTMTLPRQAAA